MREINKDGLISLIIIFTLLVDLQDPQFGQLILIKYYSFIMLDIQMVDNNVDQE